MRLLLFATLFVLAGCSPKDEPAPAVSTEFRGDGILDFLRADSSVITRIAIEIADTPAARERGLMGRRSLPERGGMLFVFDNDQPRSFWMKNTPLPLDLLFTEADGQVINIVERTTPYSEAYIESTAPARYVVEVRGGFSQKYGIDSTAWIRWRRESSSATD
ncbi:MAG: DUF192 domain-containing protein [Bacteroidota bacterium]